MIRGAILILTLATLSALAWTILTIAAVIASGGA